MKYILIGKRQGFSGALHGFVFRDGVCTIPGDGSSVGELTSKNILTRFTGAHPEHHVDTTGEVFKLHPQFGGDEPVEEEEAPVAEEVPMSAAERRKAKGK